MKTFLIAILASVIALPAAAQEKEYAADNKNIINSALMGWQIRLSAGYNIGGTAPLPLPREIRTIEGYNPELNFAIEGNAEKMFGQGNWGIRCGIRFETKGMTTKAGTKNYHMEAWNTDGSGKIQGACRQGIRSQPAAPS